jgi:hypothetical protein
VKKEVSARITEMYVSWSSLLQSSERQIKNNDWLNNANNVENGNEILWFNNSNIFTATAFLFDLLLNQTTMCLAITIFNCEIGNH